MKRVPLPTDTEVPASRHAAISAYAAAMAGTAFDLDPALESAGIEHLVQV